MDDLYVIAVDIGGTSYRVALVDSSGAIIARNAEPTNGHQSPEIGLKRLVDTIRKTSDCIDFDQLKGVFISAAGPLNPQKGILLTPPSLPAWRNVQLKKVIEESLHLPVWVKNDADLAALGEKRFGAGRGCDRLIYITVSTGIGGGIVLENGILEAAEVSVAEIGHMVVDRNGPVCNCGGKGHLEPLASGTAIARIAAEGIRSGKPSSLQPKYESDPSMLTAALVVEAARSGDSLANEVLSRAGEYLGIAITSLIHIFDPEVVIIGGGVSNASDLILNPIRDAIEERIMPDFKGRSRIVQAELGDNSGIMGAIALGLEKLADS